MDQSATAFFAQPAGELISFSSCCTTYRFDVDLLLCVALSRKHLDYTGRADPEAGMPSQGPQAGDTGSLVDWQQLVRWPGPERTDFRSAGTNGSASKVPHQAQQDIKFVQPVPVLQSASGRSQANHQPFTRAVPNRTDELVGKLSIASDVGSSPGNSQQNFQPFTADVPRSTMAVDVQRANAARKPGAARQTSAAASADKAPRPRRAEDDGAGESRGDNDISESQPLVMQVRPIHVHVRNTAHFDCGCPCQLTT